MGPKGQILSFFLAKAGEDLFSAQSFAYEASGYYFSCDFLFSSGIDDEIKAVLESRIRTCIRKPPHCEMKTMMRENAVSFLQFHQRQLQSLIVENAENALVYLFFVDGTPFLSANEQLPSLNGQEQISLFESSLDTVEDPILGSIQRLRIAGIFAETKKELAHRIKLLPKPGETDVQRDYILDVDDCMILLPKGIHAQQHLRTQWSTALSSLGYAEIAYVPTKENARRDLRTLFSLLKMPRIAEWGEPDNFAAQIPSNVLLDELTAHMQLIQKLYSEIHCTAHWVITSARAADAPVLEILASSFQMRMEMPDKHARGSLLQFNMFDRRGRELPLAQLRFTTDRSKDTILLEGSAICSVQRSLVLILEQNHGQLPCCLQRGEGRTLES